MAATNNVREEVRQKHAEAATRAAAAAKAVAARTGRERDRRVHPLGRRRHARRDRQGRAGLTITRACKRYRLTSERLTMRLSAFDVSTARSVTT